jgi:multidrug efflux pump subunit AcrB
MLCILLLFAGFGWATSQMKLSLFPEVSTNFIRVITIDPETSAPSDVERLITIPIEQELNQVTRVKKIVSVSQDNLSSIFIELDPSIDDVATILNEVRQAVDKTRGELPSSAEPPVVENFEIPTPLITFTVILPEGENVNTMRENFERIKRRLQGSLGVSDVLVDGLETRELWVEWDPLKLEAHRISIEQLAQAIRTKNLNQVGGRLDSLGGEKIVRVLGEVLTAAELGEVSVGAQGHLLLDHVAQVRETSAVEQTAGRVNMRKAVTFTLVKRKGADAIRTVEEARKIFDAERRLFPRNYETLAVGDGTKYIRTRLDTVLQNGIQALLLVTLMLMLLVNWRLAVVVGVGIPISFAGAMLVLFLTGQTINLLTMFAMIMALGMVVDDAIVVSENVYRLYTEGMSRIEAAVKGTAEVFWPVVGSVSTTIAAFLPLILGEGILGKFLAVVPIVVISALVFSVVQAFVVLPSHLADFVRKNPTVAESEERLKKSRGPARVVNTIRLLYSEIRLAVENCVEVIVAIYLDILKSCLRFRYWVTLGFVLVLFGTFALIGSGALGFKLFSGDFADLIPIKVDLPANANLDQTEAAIRQLERRILEKLPPTDFISINARIGARMDPTNSYLEFGSNLATLTVDIDEQSRLCRKPSQIENDLQNLLREFPQFTRATAQKQGGGPPVGKPVNVEITGPDFETLKKIAADIERRLTALPGLRNIGNDMGTGKSEWQIRVDPQRAAQLGMTTQEAATIIQSALLGLEVNRLRWGNEEVVVRIRMDERFRRDPEMLLGLRASTRDGRLIALESFAGIEPAQAPVRIKRQNRERMVTVSADLDTKLNSSRAVNVEIAKWLPEILAAHPGYSIFLTGENEDTENSLRSMMLAALLALLLIYGILAAITNSFIQPLIIMVVIPFGIVGVCIGLLVMNQPLGLMSIMGTIALAGIVVNNSVLLVDFVNRYHARPGCSHSRWSALIRAGRTRFRPVFLTVATTVIGLMGLATTSRGQEQFLAPMAQAIIWGLCFATCLTLIFIPCLYAIVDDLKMFAGGKNSPLRTISAKKKTSALFSLTVNG